MDPSTLDKLLGLGTVGVLILCGMFVLALLDRLRPYLAARKNGNGGKSEGESGENTVGRLNTAEWEARIAHIVASTLQPVMAQQTEILRDLAEEQRTSGEILREVRIYVQQLHGGRSTSFHGKVAER